ncbi:MAG: GumC family protein [Rhizobiaceae bacterium]
MNITSPDYVSDSFDIRTLFAILQRNLGILFLCVLAAILAAGLFLIFTTEKYTATAMILIDPRQEQIIEAEKVISTNPGLDSPVVDSEVELLRSAAVVQRVIAKLDLDEDQEFVGRSGLLSRLMTGTSKLTGTSDASHEKALSDVRMMQTTNAVLMNLAVKRRGLTYVIDVAFSSENPAKASLIANEISTAYLDDQLDAKFASTKRAREWLSNRLSILKQDVLSAESAVGNFRVDNDLISIAGGKNPLDQQLEEINIQLIAARAEVIERKLQSERRDPSSELKKDFELALSRMETLESTFEELANEASERERSAIRLRELERQANTSRNLYESFLIRYKEATEQQSLQSSDSRIVSQAFVPISPSYPKKAWVLTIALFVGVGGGITLCLLREHLDDAIRTPQDITSGLGVKCLAMVPDVSISAMKELMTGGSCAMTNRKFSDFTKAIRALLFSLEIPAIFCDSGAKVVILVTSSEPDDGKTTIALAVANYTALNGAKTLLIDVDSRAASASRRLGFNDDDPGLVQLLRSADVDANSFIKKISGEHNLYAICAGQETYDAPDFIASEKMRTLIGHLKQSFDVIIVDSPPASDGMEAASVAQLADRMVFLSLWGNTSSRYARAVMDRITLNNTIPLGVVLNRVDFKRLRKYTQYSSKFY